MAFIDSEQFSRIEKERNSIHKPATASYSVFKEGDETIFQIDTYGTTERVVKGKTSQSIQINKQMAEHLINLLRTEFNV